VGTWCALGAFAGWIAGASLGVLPISVFYAAHGAFPDLVQGLVPFEKAAEYSQRVIGADLVGIVGHVTLSVYKMFPTEVLWAAGATLLAGLAICTPTPVATVGEVAVAGSPLES
jgi:hypothetical protein